MRHQVQRYLSRMGINVSPEGYVQMGHGAEASAPDEGTKGHTTDDSTLRAQERRRLNTKKRPPKSAAWAEEMLYRDSKGWR